MGNDPGKEEVLQSLKRKERYFEKDEHQCRGGGRNGRKASDGDEDRKHNEECAGEFA